jgi:hypothetical protein
VLKDYEESEVDYEESEVSPMMGIVERVSLRKVLGFCVSKRSAWEELL